MTTRTMLLATNLGYLRRRFGVARLVCVIIVLMAMVLAALAEAGQNQWTSTGPASSGPVISLAVDRSAPETVYAGSGISACCPALCSRAHSESVIQFFPNISAILPLKSSYWATTMFPLIQHRGRL